MKSYVADIEALTEANGDFRRVLYTGLHLQLELMALKPRQDMGPGTLTAHDQFFRVEKGRGEVVIDGVVHEVKAGSAMIVPAGAFHNLRNTGDEPMAVTTLYGPPNHVDHLVQATKAEALTSPEVFEEATPG